MATFGGNFPYIFSFPKILSKLCKKIFQNPLTIFQMAQYVYCMGIKERFTKSQLAVRKDMMCKKNSGVKRGEK